MVETEYEFIDKIDIFVLPLYGFMVDLTIG